MATQVDIFDAFVNLIADAVAERIQKHAGKEIFTTTEAAKYMRRSADSVRALVARGELPAVRNGRTLRIVREDIDGWIERNRG